MYKIINWHMLRVGKMFKYLRLSKIFVPLKIYTKCNIVIRNSAQVNLAGRLTIGNPDSKAAKVSSALVNIYFGYNSKIYLKKSISIGPGVSIIVKNNAMLSIGSGTNFTSDMHIEVSNNVKIGNNCAISWGVTLIDDDHHIIIDPNNNKSKLSGVSIGNHVWIGCNSTILRGTIIGNNCIIGAGSVVKGIFPDNCLIAGNPAKIIKNNIDWK